MKMGIKEIKAEIERLEHHRFVLGCKDRWSRVDYDVNYRLAEKIRRLQAMLIERGVA